jgi:putative ABC transport system ATP-binding protein
MAKEMLIKVGLKNRLQHKPKEMSGGQQQRVGIARAFVAKPSIVFADEPTGNLDTKTTMEVMELIREIARDNHQTIVMVTHDRGLAQYADRVIHILDGKIQSIETTGQSLPEETEETIETQKEEINVEEENDGTAGSADDCNSAC